MDEIDILRHHFGHDMAELRGRIGVKHRYIQGLLQDAVDAIEIDEPRIALRRIRMAIRKLEEQTD